MRHLFNAKTFALPVALMHNQTVNLLLIRLAYGLIT